MAQTNRHALRRAPGAEGLRRAWDIALDFGVKRMKGIAFERAIEGELVPVFHAGKLQGFRRKRNDALLMFCPRRYGQDAGGRRTTVNDFKTVASAGSGGEGGGGDHHHARVAARARTRRRSPPGRTRSRAGSRRSTASPSTPRRRR